ncbi:MAG TPA: hypothetical protein VFV66_20390 [Nonomuraea sp.]|nr:hypothetical protein [Nonomuraea sp.]
MSIESTEDLPPANRWQPPATPGRGRPAAGPVIGAHRVLPQRVVARRDELAAGEQETEERAAGTLPVTVLREGALNNEQTVTDDAGALGAYADQPTLPKVRSTRDGAADAAPFPGADGEEKITELVDRWLGLLASSGAQPVYGNRQWIIDRALRKKSFAEACAFVNDAMWALRFGDPLPSDAQLQPPAVPEPDKPKKEGLERAERERLRTELAAEVERLAARGVMVHSDDRAALLEQALQEDDLQAARRLVAIWLAAEEERQQGQLWDVIDYHVELLAAVGFNVPVDAQKAILRRALTFPDLGASARYLYALFDRLYERATARSGLFTAEAEIEARRGLLLRRLMSSGASEEELEPWVDLAAVLASYKPEVDNLLHRMQKLQRDSDEHVLRRAGYWLPKREKKLAAMWEQLDNGRAQAEHAGDTGWRIRAISQLEDRIKECSLVCSEVAGDGDRSVLTSMIAPFKTAMAIALEGRWLSVEQQETATRLLQRAAQAATLTLTGILELIEKMQTFQQEHLTPRPAVSEQLPAGCFDMSKKDWNDALVAWVANTIKGDVRDSSITQACNAVAGKGKAAGKLRDGTPVWHASAGRQKKTCTVFWVKLDSLKVRIVGIGKHRNSSTYDMLWSDPAFTADKAVNLDG